MNCANHPDRERAAFCQNCGKPLCSECTRTIGTSIFCEPCFNARTTPGYAGPGYPPSVYTAPPKVPGQPDPVLAAVLGFIPGVGAMYNEQYAKGLVHLLVFAILVLLTDENGIFGLFIMGWIIYQVIEAHHTAVARRDGTPLPNPFGLNDLAERLGFGAAWPQQPTSNPNPNQTTDPNNPTPPPTNPYNYTYVPPVSHWGAPQDTYTYNAPPIPPIPPVPPMPSYDPNVNVPYQRRFPTGAIWLIGLGAFFLLANTGLFHFRGRFFAPFLLIGIGVAMFVRRMTWTGGLTNDGTPAYHVRLALALRGALWIILVGVIMLLDTLRILTWSHSWPIFLIAAGVFLFFKNAALPGAYGPGYYSTGNYPPQPGYPYTQPPTTPPVTTTAIVPVHDHTDDIQEGR